jgi:dipeptidase
LSDFKATYSTSISSKLSAIMATRTLEDAIKNAKLRVSSDSEYMNAVVLDNANVKELMASRKRSRASTPERGPETGKSHTSNSSGKNGSEAKSSCSGSSSGTE